jgi:signal transduction histidine kinase
MTSPGPARRVLVVDDQDSGRFVKVQTLRRAGFDVAEASSGNEALRLASETTPDIVVLDVHLPDISGLEVCRRLKESTAAPPAQILQVSSTAVSDADRVRGLNQGADAYLTEPIPGEVLVATVQALVRVRLAEQALTGALDRERRARQDAEEANRLKDEFIATLSHELRTPLNAIMGWVWQLQRSQLDEVARQRALASLERSTRIQAQLIDDLLDISRIAKGKLQLQQRVVDMRVVVDEAVEPIRSTAARKGVRIEVAGGAAMVVGDPIRLQQVVMNLLTNAVQFTPDGGRVDVHTAVDDGKVTVTVADNGAGIDPAFLNHVFEQFRQGDGGLSRRHGGLGLGLAIVRQLVELHGGSVQVASEGIDKGSSFTVTLPRATADEQRLFDEGQTGPLLENTRVLVVEDDGDARELLAAMLESSGADVARAASADEALELLDREPFDLLVSDIGMPGQDGLELLREVRARGYRMPAAAVTAFSTENDRQRCSEAGFGAYVSKPVRALPLVRTLAGLMAETSAGRTPPRV